MPSHPVTRPLVRSITRPVSGSGSGQPPEPATPTHSLLPILGSAAVKPVCWSNDETSDANSEILVWAMHLLGHINLVWQDQTSSTDADGHNPTLTHSYYLQEITARANDVTNCTNSGWNTWLLPSLAGSFAGHLTVHPTLAAATRPDTVPAATASLIAAIHAHHTPTQPVIFACGGPLTTLADAWLADPTIAQKVTVLFVSGDPAVTHGWYNEWADPMAARLVFRHFHCVNFPTTYGTINGATVGNGSTSLTCAATTLFPGQTVSGTGLPANTYIVQTNGSTTATLSAAATQAISNATLQVNRSFAAVPKPWLLERLPDSPIRSRMSNKTRPGNGLPAGIDGDASPLICLLDPDYVTHVVRYTVPPGDPTRSIDQDGGGAWPARNCPDVVVNSSGNLWWCQSMAGSRATTAWWNVMTTAALWTRGAHHTYTPVASDDFTRADNATLGTGWVQLGSIARNQVVSNAAAKTTTGYAFDIRNESYSGDQYAQMKFTSTPAPSYFPAVATRAEHHSGGDVNGYYLYPNSTTDTRLQRSQFGVNTVILSGMPAIAAGQTWRVTVTGNLVGVWRNNGSESTGVIRNGWKLMGTIQDTALTTGKPAMLNSRSAGPTSFADDFVAGNITT